MQNHVQYQNLHLIKHPLIKHKISILRNKNTPSGIFRRLAEEITMLMIFEALRDLETEEISIETPLEKTTGEQIKGKKLVVMPVLRAGLAMVPAILQVIPSARVGHIGLARNEETLQPDCYYFKIPHSPEQREFVVTDPMLATGGSAAFAIRKLKESGAQKIRLMSIIGAPEGVQKLEKEHPDVPVFLAQLDRQLNDKGYILPGLGDAGDRMFGTVG
ncbi:MAG: uracil phosphoribosyltransferase [Candidatus Hydrogenedentota bacterium]|nr:MAG: uracil phosphoribosyltransferase [Candidatus Hydrogenedentota bacterium]